jgi:hypothetical protein
MSRSLPVLLVAGFAALSLALTPAPTRPATPAPRLALHYKGIGTVDSVGTVFVMPGETLTVAAAGPAAPAAPAQLAATAGPVLTVASNTWRWVAPDAPGLYCLRAAATGAADTVTLHALVMVPATALRNGVLNGYRIGHYPTRPLGNRAAYLPPAGFVEVTPDNQDLYLTPHLQLGQFVTKQAGGFPKYVVLDERLLLKLERVLDLVHQAGHDVRRFRILSGYRTPHYNRAIGNTTTYSRHVYGAAADIFIDDHPADGRMDDLNGDGRSDLRDAAVLADMVHRAFDNARDAALLGGVSAYPSNAAHGPFVHVDVRGYRARW